MDSTCILLGPRSMLLCILLVTATITASLAGSPLGRCESNYTLLPHGCYADTHQVVNKSFGVQLCEKTKGHIFVVDSNQEQIEVLKAFGITDTWTTLGIHQLVAYKKRHDGKLITWSAWHPGEPTDELETCAVMRTATKSWVDVLCSTFKGRVICEKDAEQNSGNCAQSYIKLSGSCYHDTGKEENNNVGVQLCNQVGGHVLVAENGQEQNEVISQFGITNELIALGLIQTSIITKFHDGKPTSWMAWDAGQPNHLAEECIYILDATKKWHDVRCSNAGRTICEMETALTSPATSCNMCVTSAPQEDILKLLDDDDNTCVKVKDSELSANLVFGMVNKKSLTTIDVSIVAKRCDNPYLTVAAKGSCDNKPLGECRLIADTPKSNLRNCKFTCNCGAACACILARAYNLGTEVQKICEMNVNV